MKIWHVVESTCGYNLSVVSVDIPARPVRSKDRPYSHGQQEAASR